MHDKKEKQAIILLPETISSMRLFNVAIAIQLISRKTIKLFMQSPSRRKRWSQNCVQNGSHTILFSHTLGSSICPGGTTSLTLRESNINLASTA